MCCILAAPISSRADFGDFGGNSDFGGSGGGYDSGGWSSGDDWSSGGTTIIPIFTGDSDNSILGTIIWVVLIGLVIYALIKKRKGASNGPVAAGATETSAAELMSIADYKANVDSSFDEAAFTEKLSNLYVQMQNCWTDKNIEPLRPYFTDAYFTQMERQVQAYIRERKTNYVEKIAVLGVELRGCKQVGSDYHMIAKVQTRITDYTLDDASGALLSGSKTAEKFMVYEWDLCKRGAASSYGTWDGASTAADSGYDGKTESASGGRTTCPACGAPLDINASARCAYCGSVIASSTFDWAICTIKGISQRTNN